MSKRHICPYASSTHCGRYGELCKRCVQDREDTRAKEFLDRLDQILHDAVHDLGVKLGSQ